MSLMKVSVGALATLGGISAKGKKDKQNVFTNTHARNSNRSQKEDCIKHVSSSEHKANRSWMASPLDIATRTKRARGGQALREASNTQTERVWPSLKSTNRYKDQKGQARP